MPLPDRHIIELEGPQGTMTFDVRPESDMIEVKVGREIRKIKKMDLWGMVFAISGPDEQEKMMPVRRTEVMHFTKVHKIQLKQDMKKGSIVTAKCHQSVPLTVVEGLKGMMKEEAKIKGSGIPIIGG